jgi:carbon storage regulator
MLVLVRKAGESIIVGDNIRIAVVEILENKVRIGVDAPREVSVHRNEVYDAIHRKPPSRLEEEAND